MLEKEYLVTLKLEQLARRFNVRKVDFPSATSWAYEKRHSLTMGTGKKWRIVAVKEK